MRHHDLHSDSRFAGTVQRYHTWPRLRPQTVAEHCWQVMRIYWHIWGEMPPHISTYMLWHDAGELQTGDAPFAAKRRSPELKDALDLLEEIALIEMSGPTRFNLCYVEKVRCKVCDLLEMLEYGMVEWAFGNRFSLPVMDVTSTAVAKMIKEMSKEDQHKVLRYVRRLSDAAVLYGMPHNPAAKITESTPEPAQLVGAK